MCDPVRVTLATTQSCARKFPERADRYETAYQRWLQRNENDISRLKGECMLELRNLAADEAQFEEVMRQTDELNAEAITGLATEDPKISMSRCNDMLFGLETGTNDLIRYFPVKR